MKSLSSLSQQSNIITKVLSNTFPKISFLLLIISGTTSCVVRKTTSYLYIFFFLYILLVCTVPPDVVPQYNTPIQVNVDTFLRNHFTQVIWKCNDKKMSYKKHPLMATQHTINNQFNHAISINLPLRINW